MANPSAGDGLEIVSVGAMYTGPWDKKYWSCSRGKERYPYPVGYRAIRTWDGLSYTMEIRQGPKGPLFVVSSEDGTSSSGLTPDMAWQHLNKRGSASRRVSNCSRKRCPSSSSIDGVELFGFRNPFVQRLLRELVANGSGLPELTMCSPSSPNRISHVSHENVDNDELENTERPCISPDLQSPSEKQWCSGKRSKKQQAVTNMNDDRSNHNGIFPLEVPQITGFLTTGKQDNALCPPLESRSEHPLDTSRACFGDDSDLAGKGMDLNHHIGLDTSVCNSTSEDDIPTTGLNGRSSNLTSKAHKSVQSSTCEHIQSEAGGMAGSEDSACLRGEALHADRASLSVVHQKQTVFCDRPTSIDSEHQSELRRHDEPDIRIHENKLDRSLLGTFTGDKALEINDTDNKFEPRKVKFCEGAELFIPDTLEDTQDAHLPNFATNRNEHPTKKVNVLLHKRNVHDCTEAMTAIADIHNGPPFIEQLRDKALFHSPNPLSCRSDMQSTSPGNPYKKESEESQSRVGISSGSPYTCSEGTDLEQSQPALGELAKSMMTFLLPRALPLLKKTYHQRRKKKQTREAKGDTVHSSKDKENESKNEEGCEDMHILESGVRLKENIDSKEASKCQMKNNASFANLEDLVDEKSVIPDSFDDDVSDTGTDRSLHIGRSKTGGHSESSALKFLSRRKADEKIKNSSIIIDACKEINCSTICMAYNKDKVLQKVSPDRCKEMEGQNLSILLPIDSLNVYDDEISVCNVKQDTLQKDDGVNHSSDIVDSRDGIISNIKEKYLIKQTCFAPIVSKNIVDIVQIESLTDICPSEAVHKTSFVFERNRTRSSPLTHINGDNNLKVTGTFLHLDGRGVPSGTSINSNCSNSWFPLQMEKASSENQHELPSAKDFHPVRNFSSVDDKQPSPSLNQALSVELTFDHSFKDLASAELGKQTDISSSAHTQNGNPCYLEPVCCLIHPDPILSIFLTTTGNEIHLCAVSGAIEHTDRNIFIYKVSPDKGLSKPPSFHGHTLISLPNQLWCLDDKTAFERSNIQVIAEAGVVILHNSIKVPMCRERKLGCLCSSCKADSLKENGVKIVHVNHGYVSLVKKLITDHKVICILYCAPRHLVAAAESGILHVWMMISDWSGILEEYTLPSLSHGSPLIVELKRLTNSALIIGRHGVGQFGLWDFSERVLLAKFSSSDHFISQFIPVSYYSNNKQDALDIFEYSGDHNKAESSILKQGEENILLTSLQKDIVIWLLVCSCSGHESSAKMNASNMNSVGWWRLAMLTKNRIFFGDTLDSSASTVGVFLGEGIIGTSDGILYTWEMSSGKKIMELQAFNGGTVSSVAADPDSRALAVSSDHREVVIYVRKHASS